MIVQLVLCSQVMIRGVTIIMVKLRMSSLPYLRLSSRMTHALRSLASKFPSILALEQLKGGKATVVTNTGSHSRRRHDLTFTLVIG